METIEPLVARTEGLQPWRRVFHAANGLGVLALLLLTPVPQLELAIVLGLAAVGALLLDGLRLRSPRVNRAFFRLLKRLASPREAKGVASSTWFLIGISLTLLLFPQPVAVGAILVLALADPAASYLGRRWGRRPFGSGTVEGSLTFLTVSAVLLVPLAGWVPGGVTALLVTGVERAPWPLDDNLTIPLATGVLLWSLLPVGTPLL
ncbi:MAG: hypothetical protein EA351_10710 [Gemmatimonadales bacterium]|nr:MAG: hypothetical protein EA351_10710 [Gemmatimonadales bacterium]